MTKNKQEKDVIMSDIHGCANDIKDKLKNIGFKTNENPIITIGSPAQNIAKGNFSNLSTIITQVREDIENRQKANDAHHDDQYKKMYPNKKK